MNVLNEVLVSNRGDRAELLICSVRTVEGRALGAQGTKAECGRTLLLLDELTEAAVEGHSR